MKINKRIANLALAIAIALPMSLSTSILDVYAVGIEAKFTNAKTMQPISNLVLGFYEKDTNSNSIKKIFTVATNSEGKLNKDTVKAFNNFNVSNVIDENGNINLKEGSYVYMDEIPAAGYFKNVRPNVFTVLASGDGVAIDAQETPVSSGQSQTVIISKGSNGELLQGLTYDLFSVSGDKSVRIASFSTDENGLLTEAFERTPELSNIKVEVINGTLVLPAGSYKLMSKNSVSGYMLPKEGVSFTTSDSKISDLDLKLVKEGPISNKKVDTGVKIKVISKLNKKGLENQEIAIYSVDENKNETLLFVGKTNKDGRLDAKGASKGSELINNEGIIELNPGKYFYKLHNYQNSKKHEFTITSGKISEQVLTLNISNGNEVSKNKKKSKPSSTDSSAKLAKTGFASTLGYSVAGITMISSGAFMLRRKK